jgi:GLPGLI family protein
MRQFITAFLLSVTLFSFSQEKGNKIKVKYTETVHFEIPEHIKARGYDMPESGENNKILYIENGESSYVINKEDEEEQSDELDENRYRKRWLKRMAGSSSIYQSQEDQIQLEQRDLFGKEFTIEEPLHNFVWKVIATEQREILGYTCMKAEFRDSSMLVTAWFTPQIPVSFGPSGYGGLPGLILALSQGENVIILVNEVDLNPEEVIITKPKDKKTLSRDEFVKIRQEKEEERRAMWGSRRR